MMIKRIPYAVNTQKCTKERVCAVICPTDCFKEAEDYFVIDPAECISCGACVDICPEKAILRVDHDDMPEEEVKKNADECDALPLADTSTVSQNVDS